MKILFLDDMKVRHDAFAELAIGHRVTHVHTAEEAIKALESDSFDGAALDCDLADEHYGMPYASPSIGGTAHSGRAVARWIHEHQKPQCVLVHSFNPDGARDMVETLTNGGRLAVTRAPFGPQALQAWLSFVERRQLARDVDK